MRTSDGEKSAILDSLFKHPKPVSFLLGKPQFPSAITSIMHEHPQLGSLGRSLMPSWACWSELVVSVPSFERAYNRLFRRSRSCHHKLEVINDVVEYYLFLSDLRNHITTDLIRRLSIANNGIILQNISQLEEKMDS